MTELRYDSERAQRTEKDYHEITKKQRKHEKQKKPFTADERGLNVKEFSLFGCRGFIMPIKAVE
jgi:hypothetical protein